MTLAAHEIYYRVHFGSGSWSLREAAVAAQRLQRSYDERRKQINELREQMADAWMGEAAESAMTHTRPLAEALDRSSALLSDGQETMIAQLDAYNTVHDKVKEIEKEPPSRDLIDVITFWQTDNEQEIAKYLDEANGNVAAYSAYHRQSTENGARMPQDYPTPAPGGVPPVTMVGSGGSPVASGTAAIPTTAPAAYLPAASASVPVPAARITEPPAHPAPAVPAVPGGSTTPQTSTPHPGGVASTVPQANPGGGSPLSGTPIAGPITGQVASRDPAGAHQLLGGRGGGGTPGVGQRPGTGQHPGAGHRTGAGTPNSVNAGARPTSAMGARPAMASPGGLPIHTGRDSSADDTEYRRKYLTAADDAKTLFGVVEQACPPVIGAEI